MAGRALTSENEKVKAYSTIRTKAEYFKEGEVNVVIVFSKYTIGCCGDSVEVCEVYIWVNIQENDDRKFDIFSFFHITANSKPSVDPLSMPNPTIDGWTINPE